MPLTPTFEQVLIYFSLTHISSLYSFNCRHVTMAAFAIDHISKLVCLIRRTFNMADIYVRLYANNVSKVDRV